MDCNSLTMSKSTDQNLLCRKVNKKRFVLLENVSCVSGPLYISQLRYPWYSKNGH